MEARYGVHGFLRVDLVTVSKTDKKLLRIIKELWK